MRRKLGEVERVILENQIAILFALAGFLQDKEVANRVLVTSTTTMEFLERFNAEGVEDGR